MNDQVEATVESRQRFRVFEYVHEEVLLAHYFVVDGLSFSVTPYVPWPRGSTVRTWLVGLEDQVEEFPVYADLGGRDS